MKSIDSLTEVANRDAPPLPSSNLHAIRNSLTDGEKPIAIAMVAKAVVNGIKFDVSPKPIGIFETKPSPIVVLTNRFVRLYFVGRQKGLRYVEGKVPVSRKDFPVDTLVSLRKVGGDHLTLNFSSGDEVVLNINLLSDRKVRRGFHHIQEDLENLQT